MKFICSFLIGISLLALVSPSQARLRRSIPRLDSTQQAIQAEIVVVGKIVEIEDSDTEAIAYPGAPQKTVYKIANIQIKEALVGGKELTHIRIGFPPINHFPDAQLRAFEELEGGYRHDSYGINEEGCFFLQKHHEGQFYVPLQYGKRLDSKHLTYEGELGNIKRMIEVFEKPVEALQAKNSEDRRFAAWALIMKYKTAPRNVQDLKEVEIPAEESKQILKTLSEMENNPNNPDSLTNFRTLFSMLQLTDRDGWKFKADENADNNKRIKDAFDQWYKTHGEKYRLKKYVWAKK